jgi:signal transduction histidine kinase
MTLSDTKRQPGVQNCTVWPDSCRQGTQNVAAPGVTARFPSDKRSVSPDAALPPLTRLLARGGAPPAIVDALHHSALALTSAHVSVLLRPEPSSGLWTVASAAGIASLPRGPLLTGTRDLETTARAMGGDQPLAIAALHLAAPELGALLGTPAGVLVPLRGADQPMGLLALGGPAERPVALDIAAMLGDAMAVALDRASAATELAAHRDLAALMQAFVRGSATPPPPVAPALEAICRGVARLIGADIVEVWQHDRRARELVCAAASGDGGSVPGARIDASDAASATLAAALRRHRAGLTPAGTIGTGIGLVVPLRGRRRALGVLAAHGVRLEPCAEGSLLRRADDVGRQLAAILDNMELLDDVVRSRRELENVLYRLDQSEKLLALGQFVAGVAHELNNPLQGVLGHLELVRASASLPAPVRRDLALIHREANRAARIVRNLLVFAGSGRLHRRALTLNAIAGRVLKLRAKALKGAGIHVERRLSDGLPRIKGDALLLQQAVLNVVINAEQAMGQGGTLTVTTRASGRRQIEIAIEDSGPGLTPEVRSRLFEPFFTTKDVGHGTGLGLAIAYGIVQAHGGSIEACNHAAGGARFAITLNCEGRWANRGHNREANLNLRT